MHAAHMSRALLSRMPNARSSRLPADTQTMSQMASSEASQPASGLGTCSYEALGTWAVAFRATWRIPMQPHAPPLQGLPCPPSGANSMQRVHRKLAGQHRVENVIVLIISCTTA